MVSYRYPLSTDLVSIQKVSVYMGVTFKGTTIFLLQREESLA